MKYVMVVLDGAGDIGRTPFTVAKKPNIDKLAKDGTVGLYKINYGKNVNSDTGYLALLSSHDAKTYPGRGYLEALGLGIKLNKSDIFIRGNFATLDKKGLLIDRRAGRDESGLEKLCKKIGSMTVRGVKISLKKSAGHRVVIILHGKNLSNDILPNDAFRTGLHMPPVGAKNKKALFTASVLNEFLKIIEKKLSEDPINKKRKMPANTIIIRNAGKMNKGPSFRKKFGVKACCIAGIPVAKGVAKYLGIDNINVNGATGYPNTNINGKFDALKKNIKKYDFIFFHINATDIYSHDGQYKEKIKYIEKIDSYIGKFLKSIDMNKTRIIVTCDHRTASSPSYKKYRHLNLPVPFMLFGPGVKSMGMTFNEKNCSKGIFLGENKIVPFMLKVKK